MEREEVFILGMVNKSETFKQVSKVTRGVRSFKLLIKPPWWRGNWAAFRPNEKKAWNKRVSQARKNLDEGTTFIEKFHEERGYITSRMRKVLKDLLELKGKEMHVFEM
jgi:hypothetical protein